ncbi:hypothetical protein E2C01_008309 [Portunus trituberculatus]|uniref:Uncharacterized protein n=1 Tax=Portunus trituberculatus TaxID=210409 RepID=A0A5B7D2G7_PORTR|nr:hypothetical protein [Portunus trituberculatus]
MQEDVILMTRATQVTIGGVERGCQGAFVYNHWCGRSTIRRAYCFLRAEMSRLGREISLPSWATRGGGVDTAGKPPAGDMIGPTPPTGDEPRLISAAGNEKRGKHKSVVKKDGGVDRGMVYCIWE